MTILEGWQRFKQTLSHEDVRVAPRVLFPRTTAEEVKNEWNAIARLWSSAEWVHCMENYGLRPASQNLRFSVLPGFVWSNRRSIGDSSPFATNADFRFRASRWNWENQNSPIEGLFERHPKLEITFKKFKTWNLSKVTIR